MTYAYLIRVQVSTFSQEREGDHSDGEGDGEGMLCSMSALTYLLAWQLHALLTTSPFRKKARNTCVGVDQLDHMLSWWYAVATHLYTCHPHAQV